MFHGAGCRSVAVILRSLTRQCLHGRYQDTPQQFDESSRQPKLSLQAFGCTDAEQHTVVLCRVAHSHLTQGVGHAHPPEDGVSPAEPRAFLNDSLTKPSCSLLSLCRLTKVASDLMMIGNFAKFKLGSGQKRCSSVLHWNERE